jgi:hypothetical protein
MTVPDGFFALYVKAYEELSDTAALAAVTERAFKYLCLVSKLEADAVEVASLTSASPVHIPSCRVPACSNVYLTSNCDEVLHFESAVAQAKSIFEYICPGQTFFAKRQDFNEEGEDYDRAELDELESALKTVEETHADNTSTL